MNIECRIFEQWTMKRLLITGQQRRDEETVNHCPWVQCNGSNWIDLLLNVHPSIKFQYELGKNNRGERVSNGQRTNNNEQKNNEQKNKRTTRTWERLEAGGTFLSTSFSSPGETINAINALMPLMLNRNLKRTKDGERRPSPRGG